LRKKEVLAGPIKKRGITETCQRVAKATEIAPRESRKKKKNSQDYAKTEQIDKVGHIPLAKVEFAPKTWEEAGRKRSLREPVHVPEIPSVRERKLNAPF